MIEAEILPSSLLLVVGAIQAIVLGFVALLQRRRVGAKNERLFFGWLGVLLIILSVVLLEQFFDTTRYFVHFPHLIFTNLPFNFLIGPLLLGLVVLEVRGKQFEWQPRYFWHLVPAVVVALSVYSLLFQFSAETKLNIYYFNQAAEFSTNNLLLVAAAYVVIGLSILPSEGLSVLAYCIAAGYTLWRHQKHLGSATLFNIPAHWSYLTIGTFTVISSALIINELNLGLPTINATLLLDVLLSGLVLVLFLTAYGGLMKVQAGFVTAEAGANVRAKYEKSSLSAEKSHQIIHSLETVMVQEQLFLEPTLKLPLVAERLNISPNHLSQAVNAELGASFTDYVNRYRIEAAQAKLADPTNDDLVLTIAYDVGFNAKATFYSAFKKATGMTPTAYKKMVQSPDKG